MQRKIPKSIKLLIASLTSTLVFIAFVAALIITYINLKTYAVYYAEHTPHADNVDPVAIEILDNIYWNKFPVRGAYSQDYDGSKTLNIFDMDHDTRIAYLTTYPPEHEERYLFFYSVDNGWTYILDSNLKAIRGWDQKGFIKRKFTQSEQAEIKNEIQELIMPFIDFQPTPDIISLQWLYNLLNYSRFN